MIKSMTGFGLVQFENEKMVISAEVKTLNSKYLDSIIKLPRVFADKEIEVKNLLTSEIERGKATVSIDYQRKDQVNSKFSVNKELFRQYYGVLESLSEEVGAGREDIFRVALNSPEVMTVEKDTEGQTEDWSQVETVLREAIEKCNQFRSQEGEALYKMLKKYADDIENLLEKVKAKDPERIENIRNRIQGNLEEFVGGKDKVDENRFEQELIYYIEKLDINEEVVRLENHLNYFRKVLGQGGSLGKKLGFISQEIGREINTIGSKANDSDIQRHVVNMKEELEKIKEQVLNVL